MKEAKSARENKEALKRTAEKKKEELTRTYKVPKISPDDLADAEKVQNYLNAMKAYELVMKNRKEIIELEKAEKEQREKLEEVKLLNQEMERMEESRKLGKKLTTTPKPNQTYMEEFGFKYWLTIFQRDISEYDATERETLNALFYLTTEYKELYQG